MKVDPEQRARDFTTGRHPRRTSGTAQPVNQQITQLRRDVAGLRENGFGGGGEGGTMVVDQLPDPSSNYIGQPVVVRTAAGQPSGVYVGGQDAFDNPVWVAQTAGDPYSLTHKRAIIEAGVGLGIAAGVAASPTSLYVGSNNNGRVLRYTHEGAAIATYGPSGTLADAPQDVAYDPVNDRVAVCGNDAGTSLGFQVWASDFSSRIFQSAASGSGNGQFSGNTPAAIADASGNWYVIDQGNLRIQKFNAAGAYQLQFGAAGFGGGLFQFPQGIAIDNDGNVHVIDADLGSTVTWPRVQKFSATGTFLLEYGQPGPGPGQIGYPRAITCTDDNTLLVTDSLNRKIIMFRPDGTYVTETPLDKVLPVNYEPWEIADYRGSVFVIARDINSIGPDQVHLLRAGNATNSTIVVGSNGALVSPAARILDFSPDFTAVESPAGEVNIGLANPPLRIYQAADYTGVSNSAAAQKMFNSSSNGAASLEANTTYHLRGVVHIDTTDTDSSNFSVLFGAGGGLTVNWAGFMLEANFTTTETTVAPARMWATTTAAIALIGAVATAKHLTITWDGHIAITNAGTLTPQYQWGSANQANPKTLRGSWMSFTPVPSTTIGPWS